MNYYIAREGKEYGPYPADIVERYLAEGSLLPSDSARAETAQSWSPLAHIFPQRVQPPPPMPPPPVAPQASAERPTVVAQKVPPALHWAAVLALTVVTAGIFTYVWGLIQSSWIRKIDPTSKARLLFGFATGCFAIYLVFYVVSLVALAQGDSDTQTGALVFAAPFAIGNWIFLIVSAFSMKKSLVAYYNRVEPIQLSMSGAMTFFFTILYIQYHMTRIARWKTSGVLVS